MILCSCSYNNIKNVVGVYENDKLYPNVNLSLNMNYTFQYIEKIGNYCDTIDGLWEIKGRRIHINPIEYYYLYPCDTCEKSSIIVFDKFNKSPLEFACVKLFKNSKLVNTLITNEDGIASLNSDFDSLRIEYVGFKSIGFMFDNNINIVEVYLEYGNDNIIKDFLYKRNNIIMIDDGIKQKMRKISNVSN